MMALLPEALRQPARELLSICVAVAALRTLVADGRTARSLRALYALAAMACAARAARAALG